MGKGVWHTNLGGHPLSSQNINTKFQKPDILKICKEVPCVYKLSAMRTTQMQLVGVRELAIELYATNPEISHDDAAEVLGIGVSTLRRMRKDPNFWQGVYDYYMVEFEGDVVAVLKAMVREAKAGNVQAGRLVLEHSGKLQKNINITIESPFEKWIKGKELQPVENAEIVPDDILEVPEFDDLPPRNADNSPQRAKLEYKRIEKEKIKEKRNKKRTIWRKWQRRAKAAGIKPLPARRPTPGQRKEWEKKIIRKEKQASKLLREQAGNNKTPCKQKSQKQVNPEPPTHPNS